MYLLLLIVWFIFNGQITLEITLFGVVICAAIILFMCRFMDYSIKKEIGLYRNFFWMVKYILVLIWEIVKANICVVELIFTYRFELEPCIVTFESPVKSNVAKVILADSITLTPGTITVSVENDVFSVHCLDVSLAKGLSTSVFVEQLLKLEERKEG